MFASAKTIDFKGKSLKLSPLEFIILVRIRVAGNVGISGYTLMKDLDRIFAGTWTAKSGTVYPLLYRLFKEKKLIDAEEVKSPVGPAKTVYKLKEYTCMVLDDVIQQSFYNELKFLMNYIELLLNNLEHGFQKGFVLPSSLDRFKEGLDNLIEQASQYRNRIDEIKVKQVKNVVCSECGMEIERPANYCPHCGSSVVTSENADQ
ncbi:MAG: helix-turn-helix transcriptional regulator [Promethearchaeota archaeon]